MSTLIDVVEGISNSLLSYFFDPKEPVIKLKPMFNKPIDLSMVGTIATEQGVSEYQVYEYADSVSLCTLEGRREFLVASILGPEDPFYYQFMKSEANRDQLHLANMSALWHHARRFQNDKSYSARNFILASKLIVAIADSNRGRLVGLIQSEAYGVRSVTAIFVSADDSLFRVSALSDNIHWDLSERNPVEVDAPYMVRSQYDDHGRIGMVVKYRVDNPEHIYGSLTVSYTDDHPFPQREIYSVAWSVIPTPLIDLLELSYITRVKDSICSVTGSRYYEYDCVTKHKRCVTVTVRH